MVWQKREDITPVPLVTVKKFARKVSDSKLEYKCSRKNENLVSLVQM